MGGDRELVMFSGLLSAILVFAAQRLAYRTFFCPLVLSLKGLRLMAKADPYMRAVYLRQKRGYQAYTLLWSTPFRTNKRISMIEFIAF